MREPVISVLLTVYNREKFLPAAIESVLAQTYLDFELIIVDDGSEDRSLEVARQYESDSRVRIYSNEKNIGQFPNRNYAATLAKGDYIKYHDSDDIMYPHCLAMMYSLLKAEPQAGFALTSGVRWEGGPCPMLLTPRMAYQREFLGFGLCRCGPSDALFRSETLLEMGGFSSLGTHSDLLFFLGACARFNCLLLPADLYWYRSHPGQALRSSDAWGYTVRLPGQMYKMLDSHNCPLTSEERTQAKRNLLYLVAKPVFMDFLKGRWKRAYRRFAESGLPLDAWRRYFGTPRRDRNAGAPLDESGEYVMPDLSVYRP
ncbi:MAG: glycosyltransferase family A protein [Candidatus Omnitrophota bacterium]|nr:glycosyltransferase family A protein [Candidatus Omnitrophota bacterium]